MSRLYSDIITKTWMVGYMDRRIGPEGNVDRKFAEETILGIDNVKTLFS